MIWTRWEIHYKHTNDPNEYFVYQIVECDEVVATVPNLSEAQLIRVAPELLEHLQRVTDQLAVVGDMSHYKDGRIVEEAREIMRKARGE